MRCGFSVNVNKPEAVKAAAYYSEKFSKLGIDVVFDDVYQPQNFKSAPIAELAADCDLLMVFGGDGTVLRVAAHCAKHLTPILAVNLGKLGFLTDADPIERDRITDMVVNGRYELELRRMIKVEYRGEAHLALNEAVVSRGSINKMIHIDAYCNGALIDKYYADGIILSTPTGSTAYSLSAGGPILAPDVSAFVLTPIGSHSLHTRPIVFSDSKIIEFCLNNNDASAYLSIDGRDICEMHGGEKVRLSLADNKVLFVRSKADCFVDKLLDKLNYWSFTSKE